MKEEEEKEKDKEEEKEKKKTAIIVTCSPQVSNRGSERDYEPPHTFHCKATLETLYSSNTYLELPSRHQTRGSQVCRLLSTHKVVDPPQSVKEP